MQVKWTAKRPDLGPEWQVEFGDRHLAVRVEQAEFDPHALERAVRKSLGIPLDPPPSPPRFSIRETTSSHGDLFELEEDTIWTVYDGERPFWQFKGGTSHDMVDGNWSAATGSHGCDFVVLGADGLHVLAGDRYDVTCHPCPL